ncbi:tetratricopeptide repeat protein [Seonamhaeicola maritimus]|uniref:Sel1 repeat family protein n=1 Tax=Seonamhaeicola maritimus TaxID=2591822 RepID=A0A5C7GMR0_9FLAO|nr:tetratricopeptide repeat protein [Seonamhaeicola maritimus]TXG39583.1 sel1 repeat family protein [Seonamhaeicola maritimus]
MNAENTWNKKTIDFVYNPDNQSKIQLIDSFVVRLGTFSKIFNEIKGSKMTSHKKHFMLEGKRGMGKTTMLLRMGYEIENDKNLNDWLIPIVFNEEEYSIRRLYKLWERVALLLEEKEMIFTGIYDEMDLNFSKCDDEQDYELTIFNLLNDKLSDEGKKIILFIDNFGDIYKKFNKQEVQRLIDVLKSKSNFRIFGASSNVISDFHDDNHPFSNLFKVKRLKGLKKLETQELLLKLGEAYGEGHIKNIIINQPGRIEALRRLTGGVIRTIVLLSDIFVDQNQGSAFSDLEAILDRVTPLYKHRMDDLPAQQQEIVEAIAFSWDAINVNEISQKTRIVSKTVSAQLFQMEKNEIIKKKSTNNKNHFYQLSERFFNIWYLMRHGRKGDRRKVVWLVRFLEDWCDEGELITRAERHIEMLKSGDYNVNGAYYMTEALASTKTLPKKDQDKLIKVTRTFLADNNSEFLQHMTESDLEINEKAEGFYKQGLYESCLELLLKMKDKDFFKIANCNAFLKRHDKAKDYYLKSIEKGTVAAMNNLGVLYENYYKDFSKAKEYYLMAYVNGSSDAMLKLGNLFYFRIKEYDTSEKYYLEAIENDLIEANYRLGNLHYYQHNDFDKAEEFYLIGAQGDCPDAMYRLANLYNFDTDNHKKAEEYYLMAIKNGNESAYYGLALLYDFKLNNLEEAELFYKKAVDFEKGYALVRLAKFYALKLKDFEKAERYFLEAINHEIEDSYFGLAGLYAYDLKDFEKAEHYYLKAVEKDNVNAMYGLAELYKYEYENYEQAEYYYLKAIENGHEKSLTELGDLYHLIEDFKQAEKYYLIGIDKGNTKAMNNLAYLYYTEKVKPKEALEISELSYKNEVDTFTDQNMLDAARLTYAKNLLWNERYVDSKKIAEYFMHDEKFLSNYREFFSDYLYLLIAKGEFQFVYDYFNNEKSNELNIKDRLKPIWYALVSFLRDDLPNEYLRMGEELEETVVEIIEKINKMEIEYSI